MAKAKATSWDIFNSSFILQEKRFVWLDYDKGISIILVALGHSYFVLTEHGVDLSAYPSINYISTFLWGFRMPLFFIISGSLISRSLQKRGLLSYLYNRCNNILYPLVIWGLAEITLNFLSARDVGHAITNIINLFAAPRELGPLWYLNALFFIGLLYAILKAKLNFSPLVQIGVGSIFFATAGYLQIHHINAGMLTDVFEFYIFFAFGDLISSFFFNQDHIKRFTSWRIFVPLFVLFLAVQYVCATYNLNGGIDGINFVQHQLPWLYLFEALVGCAMSISLSFLLQKYRWLPFLRVVGYHSLFIYCMQIITMNFARIALINIIKITNVPLLFIAVWVIGIVVPMLIYNLCLRLNMWWLFTLKRPKEQAELRPLIAE